MITKNLLLAFLMVTLLCLCLGGCGDGESPLDTTTAFMREIVEGSPEDAYSMLCDASRQRITLEEFSDDLFPPLGEDERKEQEELFDKLSYELAREGEDEAEVYVTHADYPSGYHTIALVKEDAVWKIDFYNSSLFATAKENADEKSCLANMKVLISMSDVYAADNNGVYPASWDDMLNGYIDPERNSPFCPADSSPYTITWSADSPPQITCPNHGSP